MMMAAEEEVRKQEIEIATCQDVNKENSTAEKDGLMVTTVQKPRKYWAGSNFLQAVNACDKFLNCAYVKFQLEEELMEDQRVRNDARPTGSIERLLRTMNQGVEVEVYRQFLFEENGLEPFEEYNPAASDHREGHAERPEEAQESRTCQQE